jgi:hypothetical protein
MYEKEENDNVPKDEFWDAQQLWCQELIAARDEWEDFHSRGDKIIEFYVDDRKSRRTKRFPLFNSNVSILENALFARIPRPDVNRRFKDPDDAWRRSSFSAHSSPSLRETATSRPLPSR